MKIRDWPILGQSDIPPGFPFIVQPRDFRVIDGDTLALKGDSPPAGRVRLRAIAAPERPRTADIRHNVLERTLAQHGLLPPGRAPVPPGIRATDLLRSFLDGYALLILPHGHDPHRRMKADIVRSACPGDEFVPAGAQSVEHLLLRTGAVQVFRTRARNGDYQAEVMPDEFPFGRRPRNDPDDTPSPGW